MAARRVVIEFLGQDKTLGKTMGGLENQSSSLGGKFAKLGKVAAVGFGALAAGAAVAGTVGAKLYQMGDDALDSRDRINQIAESMGIFGNQAGAVTDRLVKLADATARNTGMDQNQIKATQAKLLTFKDLAKSADEAGGAFDRATQAAIDMEAAGFGNAASNAVQLGKALNDPIKGITALAKSGVTFTESEKERIKAMVEAGQVGKAQAKILRAIETQVGGTAEAMAGPMDRLRVTMSQAGEQIGMKLLPVVDRLVQKFLNEGLPALMRFGGYLQKTLPPIFARIRAVVSTVMAAIKGDVGSNLAGVKQVFNDAVTIIRILWSKFGANILQFLSSTFENIKSVLTGAFEVIKGIFKTVSSLLKGDWKGVWDGIKMILRGAVTALVGIVKQLGNMLRFAFKNIGVVLKALMRGIWSGIKSIISNGAQGIVNAVKAIPGKLSGLGRLFANAGKGLLQGFINGMKNAAGIITGIAGNVWDAVKRLLNGAIEKINRALEFRIDKGPINIGINPPDIPKLAKGGIVQKRPGGILANIGEGRYDEAVIPLDPATKRAMAGGGGGGGDGRPQLIQFIMDGKVVEQALIRHSRTQNRPIQIRVAGA